MNQVGNFYKLPLQFNILFYRANIKPFSQDFKAFTYMSFQKIIKTQINRKFTFHFSTPTQQLFDFHTVSKYFDQNASYNLIPGIQNSSVYDPQRILTELMPYTENSILDICLPYIETNKKKNVIRHLGRYIVVNKQLIGIRIKPSDTWPKLKTQKIPPSAYLQNYYLQKGIIDYPKEIVIGEFLIATKHFKMAPLFESELLSLTQNNPRNILTDYYSLGCQIFSIVNDINEEKRKTLKDHMITLKNYRRQSTAIVYSGMHIAPELNEAYNTRSFAMQGNDSNKQIQINKLDQINSQTIIFDLNLTKKNRKIIVSDDYTVYCSEIQTLDCSSWRIKLCFEFPQRNYSHFQTQQIETQQSESLKKQNLLLLHLWYLYSSVNQRSPFTLPCPMTDKDENFLKKIIKLSTLTNINLTAFVNFLKLDSKLKLKKGWEKQNFKEILFERADRQERPIYTYFSVKQRLSLLGIEKQDQLILKINKKVINCSGCLVEEMFKVSSNLNITDSEINNEDQKFIQRFLKRKVGNNLDNFYFQAAKYYPRHKLTSDFMQNLFERLQYLSKSQFNGSSFQNFILKCKFQDIKHAFAEAEKRYFFTGTNLKIQQDQIQEQTTDQTQNSFRNFIKKVKSHCNNLKKNYYSCHICSMLFNKKEKSNYGKFCVSCNSFVCYNCFDLKTGEYAQKEQNFQYCLVCQNRCDCDKCFRKKGKDIGMNNQNPKNSIYIRQNISKPIQQQIIWNSCIQKIQVEAIPHFSVPVKSQFSRLSESILNKPMQEQFISSQVASCFQCQLHNRAQRNIRFICSMSKCQSIVCYSCQKAQNQKRNWTLRGTLLCNKCHEATSDTVRLNKQIKEKQIKLVSFQNDLNQLKRQIYARSFSIRQPTIPQQNQQAPEINFQHQVQRGGVTPIFDRSAQKNRVQSPLRTFEKRSPSQNGSIASFGGQKPKGNPQEFKTQRKNSSKSSRSRSPPTNRQQSPEKKNDRKKPQDKNRKNSSDSGHQSLASFTKKTDKNRQDSPNGSISSKKSKKDKKDRKRDSSVQSGMYQGSESSQKDKRNKKPNWGNKNVHQDSRQNIKTGKDWNKDNQGFNKQKGNRNQNNYDRNKNQGNNETYKGYNKQEGNNRFDRNQNNGASRGQGNRDNRNDKPAWNKNNQNNDRFKNENSSSKNNYQQNKQSSKKDNINQENLLFTKQKPKSNLPQEQVDY